MSENKKESIAQQLRTARRAKGVELEDVHRATGVSLLVLEGLEAGKNDVVEPVFTRLALSSYVDYLRLDATVLAQYDAEQGPIVKPVSIAESQPEVSPPAAPVLDAGVLRLIGMVAGALVLLLIAISFLDGEQSTDDAEEVRVEPPPAQSARRALPPVSEEQVLSAADSAAKEESEAAVLDGADLAGIVASEEEVIPPLGADAAAIDSTDGLGMMPTGNRENVAERTVGGQPSEESGELTVITESAAVSEEDRGNSRRESAPPAADETLAVAAPLLLEVEAIDSTWVQVNWDATGFFQGIVPRGERRVWHAQEYFRVHSGRAHGLRYWFQGQLLGDGALGEATKVLRFRASAEGVNLLDTDLKLLESIAQP